LRSVAVFCPNRECVDFRETGEPGEYREGIAVCPKCGTRLVARPPVLHEAEAAGPEGAGEEEVAGPLVAVAAFNFHQDADLAVSMLRANGVQAVTFADDCGTNYASIGFGSPNRVMVPESQAKLAMALLERKAHEGG
jgi:hypothetical protein